MEQAKQQYDVFYGRERIGRVEGITYPDALQSAVALAVQKFGEKADKTQVRIDAEIKTKFFV